MKTSTKVSLKKSGKFTLAMIPFAIIGGYCTEIYMLTTMDMSTQNQLIAQVGSLESLLMVGVVQVTLYAIVAGLVGSYIAQKVALFKPFSIDKRALCICVGLTCTGGLILGLDPFISSHFVEDGVLDASNEARQTGAYVLSGILYGGVIEELLMRVFLMSLVSLILWKFFWRSQNQAPVQAFIIANVLTAMLFAAGHLPANYTLFGALTAYIVIRCFVLNGCYGLAFGWLYRTFGIQYAMLCHAGCHVIEWLILIILL